VVLARDGHVCQVCSCERPAEAVDHIVPWRGGEWCALDNLRAICTFHSSQRVRRVGAAKEFWRLRPW
jgi:5-methylcytosine-specific restriction endonuclease McrA